jgi:hypothetical protein
MHEDDPDNIGGPGYKPPKKPRPPGFPTPEERKAWDEKRERFAAEDLTDAERRHARVLSISRKGEFCTVEWQMDDGEYVIGKFSLFGWGWAPAADRKRMYDNMANCTEPMTFIGRKR